MIANIDILPTTHTHTRPPHTHTHTHTAPSHRPQNLTVDILGPTNFRLSWYPPPPQYHHGNIREYSVIVTEIRTGGELLLTSTTTEIVAMDLLPYTRYTCSVAAVTVAEGPYTAELVARTAEDGMCNVYENQCKMCLLVAAGHIRT